MNATIVIGNTPFNITTDISDLAGVNAPGSGVLCVGVFVEVAAGQDDTGEQSVFDRSAKSPHD